jgi:hypothetical protein
MAVEELIPSQEGGIGYVLDHPPTTFDDGMYTVYGENGDSPPREVSKDDLIQFGKLALSPQINLGGLETLGLN